MTLAAISEQDSALQGFATPARKKNIKILSQIQKYNAECFKTWICTR